MKQTSQQVRAAIEALRNGEQQAEALEALETYAQCLELTEQKNTVTDDSYKPLPEDAEAKARAEAFITYRDTVKANLRKDGQPDELSEAEEGKIIAGFGTEHGIGVGPGDCAYQIIDDREDAHDRYVVDGTAEDEREPFNPFEVDNGPGLPWVAGWNMPGYLPDSEPAEFETDKDAREYIASEMESEADEIEEEAEHCKANNEVQAIVDSKLALAAELRQTAIYCRELTGEYGLTAGRFHYWVTRR